MEFLRDAPFDVANFASSLLPACATALRCPEATSFSNLRSIIACFNWQEHFKYREHFIGLIVFPLTTHIKAGTKLQDTTRIELLQCIKEITTTVPIQTWTCFFDIFNCLNVLLNDATREESKGVGLNPALTEESLHLIVSSLRGMLLQSLALHADSFYSSTSILSVGHSIYMHLLIIEENLPLDIRLCALDIVHTIFFGARSDRNKGEQLFQFFPGTVLKLCKACSTKSGRVRETFVLVSCEVLQDSIDICLGSQHADNLQIVDLNLHRPLQTVCSELASHNSEQLRLAITRFCASVHKLFHVKCMKKCANVTFENLLVLSSDESDSVATIASEYVSNSTVTTSLCDLETVIYWLTTARRELASNDLHSSKKHVKLVCGAFLCQSAVAFEIYRLLPLLARFWTNVLEKYGVDFEETSEGIRMYSNPFSYIFGRLVDRLSVPGCVNELFGEFVNYLTYGSSLSFEERCDADFIGAISLFTAFVKKHSEIGNLAVSDMTNATQLLVDILKLNEREKAEPRAPKESRILELEVAVMIEALSAFTLHDKVYLMPLTLYYFLEYAGDETGSLGCFAAKSAIKTLAGDESTEVFLNMNVDLLLSELSIRVSSIFSNPRASSAVMYLAHFFDFGRAEFIQLIQQVLLQSCDDFYSAMQLDFAKILYAFSFSLYKNANEKELSSSPAQDCVFSLENNMLAYQQALGLNLDYEQDDSKVPTEQSKEHMDNLPNLTDVQNEDQLPPELRLLSQICDRVLNFLPLNENKEVQVMCINTLINGVFVLKSSENTLLPLAHRIWTNLAPRFATNDYLVMQKSFNLLVALCRTSRYFLKKRVVEHILPKLSSLMSDLSKRGSKTQSTTELYYTFTQEYKLQMSILEGLADLVLSIEICEEDMDKVIECCCQYVNPQQHRKLQEAASTLLDRMGKSSAAEIFWMKLIAKNLVQKPDPSKLPACFTPIP